jgi:RNA polymerase sigma-B factor
VIAFWLSPRGVDEVKVIDVYGDLDAATAPRLAALLGDAPAGTGVVVNLAGTTLIDAAAVAGLLAAMRARRQRGGELRAVAARGAALEALEVAGAAKTLGAHLDLDEGCASVRTGPVFGGSTVDDCAFDESGFGESIFGESIFGESAFEESAFEGSTFGESAFEESALEGSTFGESGFGGSTFQEPTFQEPTFQESTFQEPTFQEPTFTESAVGEPTVGGGLGGGEESAAGEPTFADAGCHEPLFAASATDSAFGGTSSAYAGEQSASAMSDIVHRLLAAAAQLPTGHRARRELRDRAVAQALPYARRLAGRYRHRGEPVEDLYQVAALGLVKAVNGYRPERGSSFIGYAAPTILGELRRYFRDTGWTLRVSRRIQELRLEVNRATETLSQALGHRPAEGELADFLDVPVEKVRQCLAATANYRAVSLSTPVGPEEAGELADAVGAEDPAIDMVDYRQSVGPLLAKLTEHEREVLALRFFGEMTQSQIAQAVGCSQMHVSRLLATVLGRLRGELVEQAA